MDIELPHIEAHRREIIAAKRVARLTAKPTKYSVKALSLMTPGYGALIVHDSQRT